MRGRGLPDDHEGTVRVVEMVGVDTNMCCGTHVSNLSHIQAVKLLHTESKRGSTLLYFVTGNRVCNLLGKCYQNERALTKALRCVLSCVGLRDYNCVSFMPRV